MDHKIRRLDANVWHKSDGVGHASLDLWDVNGNYAYISLWPKKGEKGKKRNYHGRKSLLICQKAMRRIAA